MGGSKISFYDKSGAGNSVYISGASDSVKETLGLGDLENAEEDKLNSIQVTYDTAFTKEVNVADYLSNKTMNINLDGTTCWPASFSVMDSARASALLPS